MRGALLATNLTFTLLEKAVTEGLISFLLITVLSELKQRYTVLIVNCAYSLPPCRPRLL